MTNGEKATAVLNYLEKQDSKTVINILNPMLDDDALSLVYDDLVMDGIFKTESDNPKDEVLEQWSMTFKDAVLYVRDQMDEEDLTILRAQVSKNYKQHNAPATGIDDSKVTDLLEEYGQDHDLPEGWYLDEYDADDVMLML